MYTNIPVADTKLILENLLTSQNTNPQITMELLECFEVVTSQNYFTHADKFLFQTDGLAMGVPSSGIIAEIFI
jgi:hypothetical protein